MMVAEEILTTGQFLGHDVREGNNAILELSNELLSIMLEWTGVKKMDTPWTVMTTRAPTVLKIYIEN